MSRLHISPRHFTADGIMQCVERYPVSKSKHYTILLCTFCNMVAKLFKSLFITWLPKSNVAAKSVILSHLILSSVVIYFTSLKTRDARIKPLISFSAELTTLQISHNLLFPSFIRCTTNHDKKDHDLWCGLAFLFHKL